MPVFVGISGESLSNREVPPDTYGTGLYRCDDLASGHWSRVSDGLPDDPEVRAIASSADGARLFLGTQYGVHRSDDGGHTWRQLSAPRPEYGVWSLAIAPDRPDVVLAGYEPAAIYRSDDGGERWSLAALDARFHPAASDEPKRVIDLAFDPRRPDDVYGVVEVGGLIASTDGGRTWTGLELTDPDACDGHAIAVSAAGILACTRVGVLRSDDRGESWSDALGEHVRLTGMSPERLTEIVDRVSSDRFGGNLFAGDVSGDESSVRFGLFARRASRIDYGDEFDPAGLGARRDAEGRFRAGACVHASVAVFEAVFEAEPAAVIETALARIRRPDLPPLRSALGSPDCDCNQPGCAVGYQNLRQLGEWILTQPYLRCLAVSSGGDRVWVGAGCGYMSTTGTLYESRDGGVSWRPTPLPPEINSGVFAIRRLPGSDAGLVCASRDGQVFWSVDGESWQWCAIAEGADPIYALAVTAPA